MPYWLDGNNLIGLSAAAARNDRQTRQAFLELLSGYARARGGSFTVFFDGDDSDRGMPPRGIRVRYSAPRSCDDAILAAAAGAATPGEIIVVTSDLGLVSRCRSIGVQTMDWRQFTAKMNRTPQKRSGLPQEKKIDLDDWSRYFGLDPKDLQ
jgi:predicted RNA-binding protein with PIN domain